MEVSIDLSKLDLSYCRLFVAQIPFSAKDHRQGQHYALLASIVVVDRLVGWVLRAVHWKA